MITDERAVSDTVGYVLVFALVMATIASVFTFGLAGLDDRQQAEQVMNVERAFDVFAHNVEDIYVRGAPSRATEVRLSDGILRFDDPIAIEVTRNGANVTAFPRPLVYESGDTEIVYSAGAILRSDGDGSAMLTEPPYRVSSDRTLLPLIGTTRPVENREVSTHGTVRVTSELGSVNGSNPSTFQTEESGTVTVAVESPRIDSWKRYFERQNATVETRVKGAELLEEGERLEVDLDTARVSAPRFSVRLRAIE